MRKGGSHDAQENCPSLSQIFGAFLRLGLTAFGGPAMVAYIGEMAVARNRWLSQESFREGVAVAQTIPGATAMQTAAYVGLRIRGTSGALAAYIGFGLPAFVLMLALSALYDVGHKSPISASVFRGLQVIVVAIVARAAFTFGRATVKRVWDAIIALAAAGYLIFGGNPALAILAGALIGVVVNRRSVRQEEAAPHRSSADLRQSARQALVVILIGASALVVLLLTNRRLFELAALMLRVDILAFGGGFASVPMMLHWVVQVNHWMDTRSFMDGIAMGQVTPGPIVITATFVGYQIARIVGAVVATAAVFFPSFVVLVLIVPHFDRLKQNPSFQAVMQGILASFVGLLLAVAVRFAVAVPWSPASGLVGGAAFVALMCGVGVPWVVLPGAALSAFVLR